MLRLIVLLISTSSLQAQQQFVVINKVPPSYSVTNKIPPCGCGCMETGKCGCKNCCERTADPNWRASQSVESKPITYYSVNGQWIPESQFQSMQNQFQGIQGGSCTNGSCSISPQSNGRFIRRR